MRMTYSGVDEADRTFPNGDTRIIDGSNHGRKDGCGGRGASAPNELAPKGDDGRVPEKTVS